MSRNSAVIKFEYNHHKEDDNEKARNKRHCAIEKFRNDQRRSGGGQWGTCVPGRQGTGAPKRDVQKFHNKGKKPITSKIAPAADIV